MSSIPTKLNRKYEKLANPRPPFYAQSLVDSGDYSSMKKKRSMCDLSTLEKIMIVNQAIIDKWSYSQTADKFGVKF